MENQTANALYGSSGTSQQQPPSQQGQSAQPASNPIGNEALAQSLYGARDKAQAPARRTENPVRENETPQEQLERKQEEARQQAELLYGESTADINGPYGMALKDELMRFKDLGHTDEDISEGLRDFVEASTQLDLPPNQASPILSQIAHFAEMDARGEITEPMIHEWDREARKALREKYGEVEAAERLEYAKVFVRQSKMVEPEMWESGLGSYPPIVLALAEHAPDAIKSGRVKIDKTKWHWE